MEVVRQPWTAAAVSPAALDSQCGDLQSLALQKELDVPSTIDPPAQHSELPTWINSENEAQILEAMVP